MNCELPDVQAGFRKGRGTRDQIANISSVIKKARAFQKNIYFCFIDYAKSFDCVDHSKLWKILKEMGITDNLTCLLRNLYAGQEATIRTGHGTTDWFQIRKGVHRGCILSPCLFNLYAEYIMRNAGLEETQAGLKIAGRNINNLRYADDTTLMAQSEEAIKKRTFCEENIPLQQKEAELIGEYEQLIESCQEEVLGEPRTFMALQGLLSHDDRDVRKAAFKAFSHFLSSNEDRKSVV